jgi:glucosamine--fructose-6-phosphate aminotransferase (isomerizing)
MNKFLEEIFEQSGVIQNVLDFYTGRSGMDLLDKVHSVISNSKIEQVVFTGMGSSYFISHSASTLFNETGICSSVINASELLHYNLRLFEHETLLICTSQSGESYEIREILTKLNRAVHCIGIVNDENSSLAKKAEIFLPVKAGVEEKTSTKTYVATSLVSFILGWYLAGMWDEERRSKIKFLGNKCRSALNDYHSQITGALTFLGDLSTLPVIARGPAFSTACQSALMFKEALHIPASGIPGGEFRHGPMEMVSDGFKCILFAAEGETISQSIKMAEDISRFGGKVLLITNRELPDSNKNIMQIFIDETDEYLFSVLGIVPVQLFVDLYAKSKGFEAGNFLRGSKVTEIE